MFIHSFIHFEDISYRDSETGQQEEQPRFESSKAVSVGTDLAGLRKTDPRVVMEKWRALPPCRVHRRCGSRWAQRPLEPGWRAGGGRSRRVRTALQVRSEPWLLLCLRPGLLPDSHAPAVAESCVEPPSRTQSSEPRTQYDVLLSDVCYAGSETKAGSLTDRVVSGRDVRERRPRRTRESVVVTGVFTASSCISRSS